MLSPSVPLESVLRAYREFHDLYRAMSLFDTAKGILLEGAAKDEAVNSLLDSGRPAPLFFSLPGLGDSVLLSAVARHFKDSGGGDCLVCSAHAPLFQGSKDVRYVIANHAAMLQVPQFIDFLLQLDILPTFTAYGVRRMVGGRRAIALPDCHMITHMCRMAGLHGEVRLRPWLEHLSGPVPLRLSKGREYIVIQSDGRPWKHWGDANFQRLADNLKGRFLLVQAGMAPEAPSMGVENADKDASGREAADKNGRGNNLFEPAASALEGTLDLRGKLSLPEVAALLRGARLFIGNEGGLAHLARAVDTKAVLAFSAFTDARVAGYAANINVTPGDPCRRCSSGEIKAYKGEACPETYRCVDIACERMEAAVEAALEDPAMPVGTERIPEPAGEWNPFARQVFEQWFAD